MAMSLSSYACVGALTCLGETDFYELGIFLRSLIRFYFLNIISKWSDVKLELTTATVPINNWLQSFKTRKSKFWSSKTVRGTP
jgi:hypothetical protein